MAGVLAAVGALACSSGGSGDTQGPGAQPQATVSGAAAVADQPKHRIVLEVTATKAKEADVSYLVSADQSQDNGTKLPWKKELTSNESFLVVSLVAQSKGTSGDITCKITVDGQVVKENKSSGQYAVVTCANS